jgi:PPOX class probable F420-dependent enzyme
VPASPDEVRTFLREHHHAILVTRRRSGDRLQTSPVAAGVDEHGRIVISASGDRAKVLNLRRDPRATVCAFTDRFFGPWVQADGTAEIVDLPEAEQPLVDVYRQIAGEHPDWDDFRDSLRREGRVAIRISLDEA